MVTISPCKTPNSWKVFERVPEKIHSRDPNLVPPFPGSISRYLDSKRSPFKEHGVVQGFTAWKNGKLVGRIAAIQNRSHNHYSKDKTGFFGFFDFIDDQEVSEALLLTAEHWLKENGLVSMRGPLNPSITDEVGALVEGFDSPPFVMMPYNPPYYLKHYQELGLKKARDLTAYHIDLSLEPPERILKIVERVKKATGLTLRTINMKNLPSEFKIIQLLYNETLNRNWGFFPLTEGELQAVGKELKAFVDPDMVLIAEKNGEPVGFSLVLPNINEFLVQTKGKATWAKILKFIWLLKTRKPKEARLAVLGVRPEYRNKGIGALFYAESMMRGKHKFTGGELSWIDEDNEEIIKGMSVMGAKQYKRYRIYERSI